MNIGRVLRLRRNTHASFDSLLSRALLGHLGKGWIVRDATTTSYFSFVSKISAVIG